MPMSSLTYNLGFSVRLFQPVYSIKEYYEIKITSKYFAQKFELKKKEKKKRQLDKTQLPERIYKFVVV
jgi:hypothetical protein